MHIKRRTLVRNSSIEKKKLTAAGRWNCSSYCIEIRLVKKNKLTSRIFVFYILNERILSLNEVLKKKEVRKKKEIVKLTRTRTKDNNSVNNEKKMAQHEKISSITEFDEEQEREKEV